MAEPIYPIEAQADLDLRGEMALELCLPMIGLVKQIISDSGPELAQGWLRHWMSEFTLWRDTPLRLRRNADLRMCAHE